MTKRPSPPYPSESDMKATRAPALVAFLLIIATIVTLTVLVTLELTGRSIPGYLYALVCCGGATAVLVTISIGTGKAKKRTDQEHAGSHQIIAPNRKDTE